MRICLVFLLAALPLQDDKKPFPAEVIAKVKANVLSLPAWYLDQALGVDTRKRLEQLVAAGKGSADDAAWLATTATTEALNASREESAMIAKKISDIEAILNDDLPVDRLIMDDGRMIDCRILETTATEVKIERKLSGGVGGKMTFKLTQVKDMQKGKGAGSQFATKLATAKAAGAAALIALGDWCKEQSFTKQRDYAMWSALKVDPGNAPARTAMGLGRTPDERPATKSGKTINFEGRDWDAQELRDKLLKDGHVLVGGQWFKKKDRMLTIPGLFRYEKQEKKQLLVGGDIPMTSNYVMTFKAVYNATSQQFTEEKSKTYTHRFFAPEMIVETTEERRVVTGEKEIIFLKDEGKPETGTKMSGEVKIPISCDQPILAAKIMAYAEVEQGTITCFIETQEGRTQVYQTTKKDSSSHEVPEAAVRNRQAFDVVFKVDTVAAYVAKDDKRTIAGLKKTKDNVVLQKETEVQHKRLTLDYKARLFASNSNQVEVFRATLTCGEPAPSLTKLFEDAGCGDLLNK